MTLYGKVLSVETRNLAEPTTAAAAISATTLYVADASTFDEEGGQATVAGTILAYSAIDADLDTITLVDPLAVAVEEQALVELYPPLPEKTALVSLGDDGDPVTATIPHTLKDKFVDGTRTDDTAESVILEQRGTYEWVVVDSVVEPLIQASLDYAPGELGYAFDESIAQMKDAQVTGELGAAVVNAEQVILDGVDLAAELVNRPKGTIAFGQVGLAGTTPAGNTSGTTILKAFEFFPGDIVNGNLYEISVRGHLSISVSSDVFDVIMTYTTDGTTPTTTSPRVPSGTYRIPGGGSFYYAIQFPAAADGQLKLALNLQRVSGTGFAQITTANPDYAFQWTIRDAGIVATASASDRLSQIAKVTGTSDPAPLSTFVKTWRATHHYNYSGLASVSGAADSADDGFAWQGWPPGQLVTNSLDRADFALVFFDMTDIMAQLSAAVSFTSCKLNFRVRTRSSADGLDVYVFTHTYTTTPPSLASNFAGEITAGRIVLNAGNLGNCAAGSAYSIELGPTIAGLLKAGTRRGIGIYANGTGISGRGAIHGAPMASRPWLTFTYKAP